MTELLEQFKRYLEEDGKSQNTINSYLRHAEGYLKWFQDTFNKEMTKLYRENVLEFKSYLINIKKQNAKTINAKLSALIQFNFFLQDRGVQDDIVLSKKDVIKIQNTVASPSTVTRAEVESFRQQILEREGKRNYSIVTIMAYGGLRISEVLNLKTNDYNLTSKELIVRKGKGEKQRTVYMNDKMVGAIKSYLVERNMETGCEYLFMSQKGNQLNRTVINKMFKKYSKKITPHTLRHFYCTIALEAGFSIHEVANQAGHSNIHTTLLYTNPTADIMKEKANRL